MTVFTEWLMTTTSELWKPEFSSNPPFPPKGTVRALPTFPFLQNTPSASRVRTHHHYRSTWQGNIHKYYPVMWLYRISIFVIPLMIAHSKWRSDFFFWLYRYKVPSGYPLNRPGLHCYVSVSSSLFSLYPTISKQSKAIFLISPHHILSTKSSTHSTKTNDTTPWYRFIPIPTSTIALNHPSVNISRHLYFFSIPHLAIPPPTSSTSELTTVPTSTSSTHNFFIQLQYIDHE